MKKSLKAKNLLHSCGSILGKFVFGQFIFGIALLFSFGCSSTAKKADEAKLVTNGNPSGRWEAKAQFRDKVKDEKNTVSLDIQSVWPDRLRMDVGGPLGISLASFTLKNNHTQTLLYLEKKYVEGPVSPKISRQLFKMDFSPQWFIWFAFDRSFPKQTWDCEIDELAHPVKCVRKSDQLSIQWTDRFQDKRKVTVDHPEFQVQIAFLKTSTLVEMPASLFDLKAPENYSRHQLR